MELRWRRVMADARTFIEECVKIPGAVEGGQVPFELYDYQVTT